MNRHDNLLRTDVRSHPIDEVNIGRYHVDAADALLADTDYVMVAKKRVGDTAWVASYAQVVAASDAGDKLTVSAPTMMGETPNDELKIKLSTNSANTLAVAVLASPNDDTIEIKLANATAANNTAAKIQVKIRALGTVNGIDVSAFGCAAVGNWDSAAIATASDVAVAFANGVTGDIDTITTGLTNPPTPRNITATAGGTEGDIANVAVTVYGTDFDDRAISETLGYFTANTAGSVTGTKAFKTVSKVEIPVADGADATVSIGFGSLFGLPIKLGHKMLKVAFNKAWEASAPTVALDDDELCKNTIQIVGTLDGKKDVDIYMYL